MSPDVEQRAGIRFKKLLLAQLGKPYRFGAEHPQSSDDPKDFDCSELVEWAYSKIGLNVPDGAEAQYQASVPIPSKTPSLGDVGFSRPKEENSKAAHVVICLGDGNCIEARGEPHNRVMLTAQLKWEAWKNWSGWRRLKDT